MVPPETISPAGEDDQTIVVTPESVAAICKDAFWQTETLFPAFKVQAPEAAKLKSRKSAKNGNLAEVIWVEHDFGIYIVR